MHWDSFEKNGNQWKVEIINMIYAAADWTSLNHTHWMNTSDVVCSRSIQKNLKQTHVSLSDKVCALPICMDVFMLDASVYG